MLFERDLLSEAICVRCESNWILNPFVDSFRQSGSCRPSVGIFHAISRWFRTIRRVES